jgi:hypothetical protein
MFFLMCSKELSFLEPKKVLFLLCFTLCFVCFCFGAQQPASEIPKDAGTDPSVPVTPPVAGSGITTLISELKNWMLKNGLNLLIFLHLFCIFFSIVFLLFFGDDFLYRLSIFGLVGLDVFLSIARYVYETFSATLDLLNAKKPRI